MTVTGESSGAAAPRGLWSGTRAKRERLRPTPQCWIAIGLSLVVALAALNTGANLLFAMFGLLVGTLGFALFSGRAALRGIHIGIELPRLVEARAPVRGRLVISGARARTVVVESAPWIAGGGLLVEPGGHTPVLVWLNGKAPGRGVVSEIALTVSTRAPYHLFERRRQLDVPVETHVHPRIRAAEPLPPIARQDAGADSAMSGEGGSLRDLKAYAPGDNPHHIHWRVSARTGEIRVRRFHAEYRPELRLVVDTRGPAGERFEELLERAATTVRDGLRQGWAVDMQLGPRSIRIESAAELGRALVALARAEPTSADHETCTPRPPTRRPGSHRLNTRARHEIPVRVLAIEPVP